MKTITRNGRKFINASDSEAENVVSQLKKQSPKDVWKAEEPRNGRPPKEEKEVKSERMTFRFTLDVAEFIRKHGGADLIRTLIQAEMLSAWNRRA